MSKRPAYRSLWRLIPAYFLDFITSFLLVGLGVAWMTGGMTDTGFSLEGAPAFLAFALVAAYFVVGNRYLRGTLWRHIFGTAKPREAPTTDPSFSTTGKRE